MSAYSDWKAGYLTDEEYRASYAQEQWEQDHYPDDMPFYTDDLEDPHWRCENCGHCKEFKMFRRIIDQHPQYYHKGDDPKRYEDHKIYTLWVTTDHTEMESIWICEVDGCEHFDDDYCAEFEEEN